MQKPITIASRQSPLAVAQAELVRKLLGEAAGLPEDQWEAAFPIKTYVTIGDRNLQDSLSEVGGKGLFVKEIEHALLTGEAEIAVHSMKDMPAAMPEGLLQAAVPKREDPRDAFVSLDGARIEDLSPGAAVGTSSVRRAAQLRRKRPDLKVVAFRGNVQTRLQKLADGVAHGTFLAEAGLRRLGRSDVERQPLDPEVMLPALSQGALCIQTREGASDAFTLCRAINCAESELATSVERGFLARLDGSCRTPMAGLARLQGDHIHFVAEILHPEGTEFEALDESFELSGSHADKVAQAVSKGEAFADVLLGQASPSLRSSLTNG